MTAMPWSVWITPNLPPHCPPGAARERSHTGRGRVRCPQADDAHWTPMNALRADASGVRVLLAAVLAAVFVLAGCTSAGGSNTYKFTGATKLGSLIPEHDRKAAG